MSLTRSRRPWEDGKGKRLSGLISNVVGVQHLKLHGVVTCGFKYTAGVKCAEGRVYGYIVHEGLNARNSPVSPRVCAGRVTTNGCHEE